jgi:hypothetical protein
MIEIESPDTFYAFCRHAPMLCEKASGSCDVMIDETMVFIDVRTACRSVAARYECACKNGTDQIFRVEAALLSYVLACYSPGGRIALSVENGTLVVHVESKLAKTTWCIPLLMNDDEANNNVRFPTHFVSTFPLDAHVVSGILSHSDRVRLECKASHGCVRCDVPNSHEHNPGGIGASVEVTSTSQGEPFRVVCKWKFLSMAFALFSKKTTPWACIDSTQTTVLVRTNAPGAWKCAVSLSTLDPGEFE